ncbi:MAG TPA: ABC transporter permease [Magnetospirillaceae bacterium]|jgi:peptide/nickel transport system permease protein
MSVFLLKRLSTFAATLIAASIVIFLVLEILPGNAAEIILGPEAHQDQIDALSHKLGLDRPAPERYVSWVGGLLSGDFGESYAYQTPASDVVIEALEVTVPLSVIAVIINIVLGLSAGVYAAARHNKLGDVGVMALSQLGIAIPSFWLGILLILVFAVWLGWLPAGGFPGWDDDIGDALEALILPAIALAVFQAAILARTTRSAVLEVSREDFVRTARAKGLTRRAALWRHVLRNAMIPIITIVGLQFANLFVLTIVVEPVFSLPGLGMLILHSIANRDVVVVQDVVMLLVGLVLVVNLAVDLVYAVIDPRLQARRA